MKSEQRTVFLRILSLLAVIAISIFIYSIRSQVRYLALWGYPGIFIISILANATVLLPAPGVAVVFAMGGILNPWIVGIVAGVGSAIGELSSYMAGYSGQVVIEKAHIYTKIHPYVKKYGNFMIFILAAIPNPFFDLGGIAAGALKMPVSSFLLWCTLGKIIKMIAFAFAGAYSATWAIHLLK